MTPDDVATAHRRLLELVDGLADDQARAASACEGWTVGHVVTHLARNADSFTQQLEGIPLGEEREQYPGGQAQRNGEIEDGAGRPAAELVDDLRQACARLEQVMAATTDWTALVRRGGQGFPASFLPLRRVREVEIHATDLGLGRTWQEWDPAYVDAQLADLSPDHRRHLVAWLAGRTTEQPPGLFG